MEDPFEPEEAFELELEPLEEPADELEPELDPLEEPLEALEPESDPLELEEFEDELPFELLSPDELPELELDPDEDDPLLPARVLASLSPVRTPRSAASLPPVWPAACVEVSSTVAVPAAVVSPVA